MKTLIESINTLNKNISEAAVEKETVLEGLQEFVDVINENAETTVESIADAAEKIAEILPDKIGGGSGGIQIQTDFTISEGVLSAASVSLSEPITVNIPEGVTTIGNSTFYRNTLINTVNMPDSVALVEDGYVEASPVGAFSDCSSLQSIRLSTSLTRIATYMFQGCTDLVSISIPNSITTIGDGAFSASGISSLMLPNSITTIETEAFYDCKNLTTVTIFNSIVSIDDYAFQYCNALTDIYYIGTQAEWEQIIIGEDAIPEGVIIHYNYTPTE